MVLGLLVLLFSGCRVYSGDYKISGRVTSADPNEGITGVTINCETNYMKKNDVQFLDQTKEEFDQIYREISEMCS